MNVEELGLRPAVVNRLASNGITKVEQLEQKRDEDRNIGLGPEHDWASHGSDAFGLMAVAYEPPRSTVLQKIDYSTRGIV